MQPKEKPTQPQNRPKHRDIDVMPLYQKPQFVFIDASILEWFLQENFEIKTTFIMEQFHHNSDDKFALIILQETTQELDFNVVGIMNTRRIQKETT